MHIKNKRGQSTVEYILLMTAVVAVIIALVAGNNSVFQQTLFNTANTAVSDMGVGVDALSNSHAPNPNATGGTSAPPYSVTVAP
jgi:hypothetical protein